MTPRAGTLAGRRIVVSAGPTYEDIDPVRFLGNRSSGRMGFAIAAAAARRGADVVLVAGPVVLPTPQGVARVDVRSARQMHRAVLDALPADAYVGAAAVADWTPLAPATGKLKKQPGEDRLVLEFARTADILADVARHPSRPRLVVGFAAETSGALADHARAKLHAKGADAIAANRVGVAGSGFEAEDNALEVWWRGGSKSLGPAPKARLAEELLDLFDTITASTDQA
jgi:phosphopantothenoylcysteine decarboxylase/phosphopantothenate--cysteine ligase